MTHEELRNKLDEYAQSYGFTDFDKWNNYENLSTNTVIPTLLKLLDSMCEEPEVRGEIEEKLLSKMNREMFQDERKWSITAFYPDTVVIDNQVWMSENLIVDDGGEGIYHNETNGEVYYTWEAANRIADQLTGWHLPSREEWDNLCIALGGFRELTDEKHHNFRNLNIMTEPFNAMAAGYFFDQFQYQGHKCEFWSNECHGHLFSMKRLAFVDQPNELREVVEVNGAAMSVRLVMDNDAQPQKRIIPDLKKPMHEPPKIPWHILSEEKPTRSGTFLIMDSYGGMSEASFNLPDATWFQYRWNCQNYNVVKWVSFDELRGDDE